MAHRPAPRTVPDSVLSPDQTPVGARHLTPGAENTDWAFYRFRLWPSRSYRRRPLPRSLNKSTAGCSSVFDHQLEWRHSCGSALHPALHCVAPRFVYRNSIFKDQLPLLSGYGFCSPRTASVWSRTDYHTDELPFDGYCSSPRGCSRILAVEEEAERPRKCSSSGDDHR